MPDMSPQPIIQKSRTNGSSCDALLESMQSLSIAAAGSRSPAGTATTVTAPATAHSTLSSLSAPSRGASTGSSGSTGALFNPGSPTGGNSSSGESFTSTTTGRTGSPSGSESSSQLLFAFFSASASESEAAASLDGKAYKLALWQAILVTVGVCESTEGTVAMPGLLRPAHFPKTPLTLPTSLKGCRILIKRYIFVNIVNFKESQIDEEPLLLFPRYVV